jgi:hypothetical protein
VHLLNATPLLAACMMSVDPDGRERAVIVVKGTFDIPTAGGVAPLGREQMPLVYADTFTEKPGESAMVYESEFAPFKPRCDVLLLGSAHAPAGQVVLSIVVALQLGGLVKRFEVFGQRHWTMGLLGLAPSRPKPFSCMPISYDVAFGGVTSQGAFRPNPVGRGYFEGIRDGDILGQSAPQTQEIGTPISSPRRAYRPMSLGPVGRNFAERLEHAGTYDDAWLEVTFPFLPSDFQYEYFQSAPKDQQIPYPQGGEQVQLLNLSPEPIAPFLLPTLDLPVHFVMADGTQTIQVPVLDTIVLEPDLGRLQLLWRTSIALRKGPRDLREVAVGHMSLGWRRARVAGKLYFRSLAELADAGLEFGP